MTIVDAETCRCFQTFGCIADARLTGEDQFDVIGNWCRDSKIESDIGRAIRIACEIAFQNAVSFNSVNLNLVRLGASGAVSIGACFGHLSHFGYSLDGFVFAFL